MTSMRHPADEYLRHMVNGLIEMREIQVALFGLLTKGMDQEQAKEVMAKDLGQAFAKERAFDNAMELFLVLIRNH